MYWQESDVDNGCTHSEDPESTCRPGEIWNDGSGYSCLAYYYGAFCTEDGEEGSGWDADKYGSVESYYNPENSGKNPFSACGACGGGIGVSTDEPTTKEVTTTSAWSTRSTGTTTTFWTLSAPTESSQVPTLDTTTVTTEPTTQEPTTSTTSTTTTTTTTSTTTGQYCINYACLNTCIKNTCKTMIYYICIFGLFTISIRFFQPFCLGYFYFQNAKKKLTLGRPSILYL